MATFTNTLQGTNPTIISATDTLQFAGGTFNSPVAVSEYQSSCHVKDATQANKSAGNSPRNVKFISQSGGTGGKSQGDWGGGIEDLDQIQPNEANLKINFSHGVAVATTEARFYAYDGSTVTIAPNGVDVRAAEVGDTNWTEAEGQASALLLDDQSPSTSHNYYIAVSCSPSSIGTKSFKFRFELAYY